MFFLGVFCQRRSTQPQPQVTRFRQRGASLEEHISQLTTTRAPRPQGARGHVVHQGQGGGRQAPHPEQGQGGPASAGMRSRPRDRLGLAGLWAERVSCERLRRAGEYKEFHRRTVSPLCRPLLFPLLSFFCRPLSFTRQRGSATSSARLGTSRKSLNGDACACWHAACGRTPRSTSPKSAAQPEGRRSSQAAAAGRPPACPRGAASAADDAAADAARYEHPP